MYLYMYVYICFFSMFSFFQIFFLISEYVDLYEGFQVETYAIKSMINQ